MGLYTLSTIPGGTTKNIPRLDIDQIMKVPEYNEILKKFLEPQKALIPYLFLEAVHNYVNAPPRNRPKIAKSITKQYLDPNCSMKISFDAELLEELKIQKKSGPMISDNYFEKLQEAVIISMGSVFYSLRDAKEYEEMIATQTLNKGRTQCVGPNHRSNTIQKKSSPVEMNNSYLPIAEDSGPPGSNSRRNTQWDAKTAPQDSPQNKKKKK